MYIKGCVRCINLVLILSLILMLFACSKNISGSWQDQYDLGQKYLQELDYEQALVAFTNAIKIDPNKGEAYIGRGDTYVAIALGGTDDSDRMQSYTHAREDYEAGILYIEPDWELVDKMAEVYYQIGDIDSLRAFMDEMHEQLGDSEIYDKWSERIDAGDAGTDEGENAADETDWDAYEQEIADELSQATIGMQVLRQAYFLSFEQRREVYEPLAQKIQVWIDAFPERANRFASDLNDIYYMMGDMDKLLEIRAKLYALTGNEDYNPDGHTVTYQNDDSSGEEYDGCGNRLRSWSSDGVSEFEYDEHGRVTLFKHQSSISSGETRYEYDGAGRLSVVTTANAEGPQLRQEYTYSGQEMNLFTKHLYGSSWGDYRGFSVTETNAVYTLNKYGKPTHVYRTDMNGAVMDDYDMEGANWDANW